MFHNGSVGAVALAPELGKLVNLTKLDLSGARPLCVVHTCTRLRVSRQATDAWRILHSLRQQH